MGLYFLNTSENIKKKFSYPVAPFTKAFNMSFFEETYMCLEMNTLLKS